MASYQKMIIKVSMNGDEDRSRAMRIATKADGRIVLVQIQGQDMNQLVVVGEGIDLTKLISSLRKKFHHAHPISCQPITTSISESLSSSSSSSSQQQYYPNAVSTYNLHERPSFYCYEAHYPNGYRVVNDSYTNTCTIL